VQYVNELYDEISRDIFEIFESCPNPNDEDTKQPPLNTGRALSIIETELDLIGRIAEEAPEAMPVNEDQRAVLIEAGNRIKIICISIINDSKICGVATTRIEDAIDNMNAVFEGLKSDKDLSQESIWKIYETVQTKLKRLQELFEVNFTKYFTYHTKDKYNIFKESGLMARVFKDFKITADCKNKPLAFSSQAGRIDKPLDLSRGDQMQILSWCDAYFTGPSGDDLSKTLTKLSKEKDTKLKNLRKEYGCQLTGYIFKWPNRIEPPFSQALWLEAEYFM
jgi:hypothetical protein